MPILPLSMHGQFTYPGLEGWPRGPGFKDANYVCSHGWEPGVVTVQAYLPIGQIAENGDGLMTDNLGRSLPLRDLHLFNFHPRVGASDKTVTLYFHDRRWRNYQGEISGVYNVTEDRRQVVDLVPLPGEPQGGPPRLPPPRPGEEPVRPATRKAATDLIALLFRAMGETSYTVTGIDPNATPYVNWDAALPAQELDRLVTSLGCRLCYRPADNAYLIAPLGEGDPLPGGGVFDAEFSVKPKPRPALLRQRGARRRWQMRFALEMALLDFDGSWRSADDVSWRPLDADYSLEEPGLFPNIWRAGFAGFFPGDRRAEDGVALAEATLWRAYRIMDKDAERSGPLLIPPDGRPREAQRVRQQVRILDTRLQLTRDDIDRYGVAPAIARGRHSPPEPQGGGRVATYEHTKVTTQVYVPFNVIEEYGIILFAEPVTAYDGRQKKYLRPELTLECACEVVDGTGQFERYYEDLPLEGGVDPRPHVFLREDVEYKAVAEYQAETNRLTRVTDNRQLLAPRVAYNFLGELRQLQQAESQTATYPGVRAEIQPDGAVHQVTYGVGGDPTAWTRASRNGEHDPYLPSFYGRKAAEETMPQTRTAKNERLLLLGRSVAGAVRWAADFFAHGAGGER